MSKLKEVVGRLQDVKSRVNQVMDVLPTTQSTSQNYEGSILQAGAESLRLIDKLTSGEKVALRSITSNEGALEDYIQSLTRKSQEAAASGSYVVIEVNKQRFLGIARLVKREMSTPELRELYRVDKAYGDEVIVTAKNAGQLELTTDVGVQVSFSLMPLSAISEVHQVGTKNAKLAAHATATNILTSAEASQLVQTGYEDDCHDDNPGLSLTDTHYITPIAMALSAATETAELDRIISATTMTTAALHRDLNPTLAATLHMHDMPGDVARNQTQAIGETGLLGGVSTHELIFWLQGWDKSIYGVNQAELRKSFSVLEVLPESSLATAQSLNELTADQKLELTIISGTALTAPSAQLLEKQVSKISDKRNLMLPVRQIFKP